MKTGTKTNPCIWLFIAALFTIPKKMKTIQKSIDRGLDKQTVYTHSGILSHHKRNEVPIPAPAWVNLEAVMLSERSQTQNVTYCMIPFYLWNSQDK